MQCGHPLKLVTTGCKSVNQHTCMPAEDCRTEVLTLQWQCMARVRVHLCVCLGEEMLEYYSKKEKKRVKCINVEQKWKDDWEENKEVEKLTFKS